MKLSKIFWITLVIMLVLFILPTFLTWGAPAYDGSRTYGFPLTFYSFGGLCYSPNGGELCSSFSILKLIVDLVILIGLPLLINYIFLKFKK